MTEKIVNGKASESQTVNPKSPAPPPVCVEKVWASRAVHFKKLEDLEIERGNIFDFSVKINGLRYDCRLNDRQQNDMLVVMFNGSVDRNAYALPAFARWNWHDFFKAPILAVFDPLLYLEPTLRTGWYVGTRSQDTPDAMARLIESVSHQMGIQPDRIVCYGSSAGGFGAITVASRMEHGRFVSFNAQTNILRYKFAHIQQFNRLFDVTRKPSDNAEAYPARWSAIHAVCGALDRGADLRGIIMQNTEDVTHLEEHYKPFCKVLDLPVETSTDPNARIITGVFTDPKGHGPEPASLARKVLDEYIPRLLLR